MNQQLTLALIGPLILVQILFAINFIVSKSLVSVIPPLAWAHLRVILSVLVLLPFAIYYLSRTEVPKLNKKFLLPLFLLSLLGITLNQGAFLIGLSYTTATNASILMSLIPIFTLFIVVLKKQETLTMNKAFGFVLAFIGVLIIRNIEDFTLSNQTFLGDLLIIFNAFCFALFLSFGSKFFNQYHHFWVTFGLLSLSSVSYIPISFTTWTSDFVFPPLDAPLIALMSFAVVGATIITYFLNVFTIKHINAAIVSLFAYLQPVFTALLAYVFLGESMSIRSFLSFMLIFSGLTLSLAPQLKQLNQRQA